MLTEVSVLSLSLNTSFILKSSSLQVQAEAEKFVKSALEDSDSDEDMG